MALKVITQQCDPLPDSLDGVYLFPYQWFQFGIDHGHLEIEDLEFYDTIQGSVYLALRDAKALLTFHDEESQARIPVWYLYRSGSGIITPVIDFNVNERESKVTFIHDTYLKTPVIYCDVSRILKSSKNDQKTINNSIIQLLKGCKVKLKHSVWY